MKTSNEYWGKQNKSTRVALLLINDINNQSMFF